MHARKTFSSSEVPAEYHKKNKNKQKIKKKNSNRVNSKSCLTVLLESPSNTKKYLRKTEGREKNINPALFFKVPEIKGAKDLHQHVPLQEDSRRNSHFLCGKVVLPVFGNLFFQAVCY